MKSNINPEKLIKLFLQQKDAASSTIKTYETILNYYYKVLIKKNLRPHPTKSSHLIIFKKHLRSKGRSPLYINLCISVLKNYFTWQLEANHIKENPASSIKKERIIQRHRRGVLTRAEVRQMFSDILREINKNPMSLRNLLILHLAYFNGLRAVEVSRLNISDIDLKNQTIKIRSKGYFDQIAAGISDNTSKLIEEYIQARIDNGENINPDEPLIRSYSTNPTKQSRIKPATVSRIIGMILKKSNLKRNDISAHSMRHSAAVHLITMGESLNMVQLFLRHTNPATTEIYVHYGKQRLFQERKLVEKLTHQLHHDSVQ